MLHELQGLLYAAPGGACQGGPLCSCGVCSSSMCDGGVYSSSMCARGVPCSCPAHPACCSNAGPSPQRACCPPPASPCALRLDMCTRSLSPQCAEAYNNLGVIHKERDHLDKATECYMAALHIRPNFPQVGRGRWPASTGVCVAACVLVRSMQGVAQCSACSMLVSLHPAPTACGHHIWPALSHSCLARSGPSPGLTGHHSTT